jgi:hypothetical protein
VTSYDPFDRLSVRSKDLRHPKSGLPGQFSEERNIPELRFAARAELDGFVARRPDIATAEASAPGGIRDHRREMETKVNRIT